MSFYEIMVTRGWGWPLIMAAGMTIAVSLAAFAVGIVVGALVAWAKIGGGRIARAFAEGYTTVLRGIPDLLVIYLFYFGGSAALSAIGRGFGHEGFIGMPAFLTGALAVGIVSAAYQAEVYRGAFGAIARGELEAARAVGMGRLLRFRRVIGPQVMRFALPGLGNCWQLVLKESALISVTGLVELLRQAQVGAGSTRQPFYFYLTGAALYLLLTTISTWMSDRAETRALRGLRKA
jgi:octopine/nopaline transport system permease protein